MGEKIMRGTTYLQNLLIQQKPDPALIKILQNDRDNIDRIIRDGTGISKLQTVYAGSYAKGTLIAESFDLDVVVYFPSQVPESLVDLHEEVRQILNASGYPSQPKNVALRCNRIFRSGAYPNFHIDVVPGKRIKNSTFAYLYQQETGQRIRTSVKTHVDVVKATKQRDILKLLKLWKVRQKIDVQTFVLELLFLRFMKIKPSQENRNLCDLLQETFTYIANTIMTIKLVDPANTQNVISNTLPDSTKQHLQRKAEAVKYAETWDEVFSN